MCSLSKHYLFVYIGTITNNNVTGNKSNKYYENSKKKKKKYIYIM